MMIDVGFESSIKRKILQIAHIFCNYEHGKTIYKHGDNSMRNIIEVLYY